jgi:predicted nuclease of predicted toxin-antitoxin system
LKILIDECVPRPIIKLLKGHVTRTAQEMKWGGISNGELLRRAEGDFDLFVTADQNIRYQQNLAGRKIAILVLSTNNLAVIVAHAGLVTEAIGKVQPADFVELKLPPE